MQQTMLENGYIENYASAHVEQLMTETFKSNHDSKVGRRFWAMIRHLLTVVPQADHFWASKSIRIGKFKTGESRGFPIFKIEIDMIYFKSLKKFDIDENSYRQFENDVDFYGRGLKVGLYNHEKIDFKRLNLQKTDIKDWNFTNTDTDLQAAMDWVSSVADRIKQDSVLFEKYANGYSTFPSAFKNDQNFEQIGFLDQREKDASYKVMKNYIHHPENKIYFGPAGTGKTHFLQKLKKSYEVELITQDKSSFISEKLRDLSWREVICLIFLEEKRTLRATDIRDHLFFMAKERVSPPSEKRLNLIHNILQRHAPLTSHTVKYNPAKRSDLSLFDKGAVGLWYLIPSAEDQLDDLLDLLKILKKGAQPSETIQRYSFVTFHQSYGYEDFMEGLRPVLDDDSDSGQVRYEIKRGAFLELCERARLDPQHPYAIFIDEINRGNVSKIFGELISLIELDKREGTANALSVILPYSGQKFSVPANVSIYGSMNTADRSLTPLDTALRRRFEFIELMPDAGLLNAHIINGLSLGELLQILNSRIEILIGRDYLLGHAYFYAVQNFDDLKNVFKNKILPLLQEYFYDDWSKIRLVLNDQRKPDALQFVQQHKTDQRMQQLFGDTLDIQLQPQYTIQHQAFDDINAYRGIL